MIAFGLGAGFGRDEAWALLFARAAACFAFFDAPFGFGGGLGGLGAGCCTHSRLSKRNGVVQSPSVLYDDLALQAHHRIASSSSPPCPSQSALLAVHHK